MKALIIEALGNAADKQGLKLSQGLRSAEGILGPSPARLCAADITSHLVWRWKAFLGSSRGRDAAALPACEQALQSLPGGNPLSIAHKCNGFAQEWNLRNIYQKGVVSSRLLELPSLTWAQLILLPHPQVAQSIILARGMAGIFLGQLPGCVLGEMGLCRVTDTQSSCKILPQA